MHGHGSLTRLRDDDDVFNSVVSRDYLSRIAAAAGHLQITVLGEATEAGSQPFRAQEKPPSIHGNSVH